MKRITLSVSDDLKEKIDLFKANGNKINCSKIFSKAAEKEIQRLEAIDKKFTVINSRGMIFKTKRGED